MLLARTRQGSQSVSPVILLPSRQAHPIPWEEERKGTGTLGMASDDGMDGDLIGGALSETLDPAGSA